MKNTNNVVEENTRNAFVYIHIFADGSKYFGNGVKPDRPFKQGGRGPKYMEALIKNGAPVIQIRRNLTVDEADDLERTLFDKYVTNNQPLQRRPTGNDLKTAIRRGNSTDPIKLSKAKLGKPLSKNHAESIGKANKGKRRSKVFCENISIRMQGNTAFSGKRHSTDAIQRITASCHRKVISMIDGRITTHIKTGHWNKKNPDYIGTWVDL
jgi:hypothetical protein